MFFDDDICWCGNSEECENKECFRHLSNKKTPNKGEKDIFTIGMLKGTEYCPLEKG